MRRVSIPFIAGQWSLQLTVVSHPKRRRKVSIPFIAGQWSLPAQMRKGPRGRRPRFNPRPCGAVVASSPERAQRLERQLEFQSPSLRGSGRFENQLESLARLRERVSIPFIAGQWSLPKCVYLEWDANLVFQSPSLRGSGRFYYYYYFQATRIFGFNPLHCGAVVASRRALF